MEQSTGQPSLDGRDNNNSSSTELNPAEIRKLEAESGKLEAETNLLLDELRRPWHRKRYFYQAITAGLVALPLVWFYYENFAFPLARAEFIEKELKNAEDRKKLAALNERLERERNWLDKRRRILESEKKDWIADKEKFQIILANMSKELATISAVSDRRLLGSQASQLKEEIRETFAKPVLTVAVLGHEGHGKSTLTAAITRVMSATGAAKSVSYDQIANSSEITMQGITLAGAVVEYGTHRAHYIHIDCRAEADCVKLLSSREVKLDGVILVVSAADGPMPQTREQIRLAHERGIRSLVVYLNKIDMVDDPELLDLVELEVRELLSAHGFNGDEIPVIRGSALMALRGTRNEIGKDSILTLLDAMDVEIGVAAPNPGAPAPRERGAR